MRTVAAARAIEHVEGLLTDRPGLSHAHVARLAGLTAMPKAISRCDVSGRITPDTEERLLAVTPLHITLAPPYHAPREPVLRHIDRLMDAADHVSLNLIGTLAGVSYQTMYNLRSGASENCRYSTFTALMAVTPEMVQAGTHFVPIRETLTRLRALEANGWSRTRLDEMMGRVVTSGIINREHRSGYVTVGLAAQVKGLYEALGDTPGPSTSARNYALSLGYNTPIHYDENMNLIEVDEAMTAQEQARIDLCILGMSIEDRSVAEIVEALGLTSDRYVSKVRSRAGIRITRTFDGSYVAAESRPGAIAAIREAIKPIHYRTTIDLLDEPGTDYLALLGTLTSEEQATAAA